jgi:glyoxylate reductase
MSHVFVTRTLPGGTGEDSPLARLRAACEVDVWGSDAPPTTDELLARSEGADGLLTMLTERIDGTLLDARPSVRVVANMAVGYDNIDVPACTERGVLVTNTPGVLTDATADMAWALLMAAARRLPEGRTAIEDGSWGPWNPTWLLGADVTGATLGIVGPGRIGAATARRAQGFDMRVIYTGRSVKPDFPGEFVSLDELLATSDYVSIHVPLSDETRGMCDAAFFARMQPRAIFVNTSRGPVVDQHALLEAVERGTIGGAGLDVMTPEPLPVHDPLLRAPGIVLAPHLGSATPRTRTRMAHLAVDGLLAGLSAGDGAPPEHPGQIVNPEALARSRGTR